MNKRIVIGMSGASGAPLTLDLLRVLKNHEEWETHLVLTHGAERVLREEADLSVSDIRRLADVCYDPDDMGAPIASGTFRAEGMIVVPCSMKSLAGIVSGYSDNLLLRAADVTLKQRRKLVLAVRETPLSQVHLRNMLDASRLGASVIPPVMSFYSRPQTVEELIRHFTGKLLDEFGIETEDYHRWKENNP